MGTENQALLSNRDGFTVFQFGKHTIRFRAPYSLERYTEIKEWDNGHLVVMAKYKCITTGVYPDLMIREKSG